MSCLHPIEIPNRSSKISYRGSALINTCECGKCVECRKSMARDWRLRAWFEWLDVKSKGGYCYMDTMTYAPKYLPKHYGIRHFDRSHISFVMRELRIYLTRAGYDVSDKLRFVVSSEFGGKKHRPHYHILLYVLVPGLDVRTLQYYLSKAWKFGRLDYDTTPESRIINSMSGIEYVTKYITKDQEWLYTVERRLSRLKRIGSFETIEKFKEFVRQVQPFHRGSIDFGACFVKYVDVPTVLKNGYITIPDKQYVFKNYAIPMYYKRKLLYTLEKNDGKLHWRLNELGIEYKVNRLDELIKSSAQRYSDIFNNLWSYNYDNWYDEKTVKSMILDLLDGRTFLDLARYTVVFRNKVWFSIKPLLNYKDFYRESLKEGKYESHMYDDDPVVRAAFRSKMRSHIVNSQRFECFRGFDELISLFRIIVKSVNDGHERQVQKVQAICDRLKLILAA